MDRQVNTTQVGYTPQFRETPKALRYQARLAATPRLQTHGKTVGYINGYNARDVTMGNPEPSLSVLLIKR